MMLNGGSPSPSGKAGAGPQVRIQAVPEAAVRAPPAHPAPAHANRALQQSSSQQRAEGGARTGKQWEIAPSGAVPGEAAWRTEVDGRQPPQQPQQPVQRGVATSRPPRQPAKKKASEAEVKLQRWLSQLNLGKGVTVGKPFQWRRQFASGYEMGMLLCRLFEGTGRTGMGATSLQGLQKVAGKRESDNNWGQISKFCRGNGVSLTDEDCAKLALAVDGHIMNVLAALYEFDEGQPLVGGPKENGSEEEDRAESSASVRGGDADHDREEESQRKTKQSAQEERRRGEWYYIDLRGDVQGPFTNGQMAKWFAVGMLPPDLLVRRGKSCEYICCFDVGIVY
jgi:hypothetical protein